MHLRLLEKVSRKRVLTKMASGILPEKMAPWHTAECFLSFAGPVSAATAIEMIVQTAFIEYNAFLLQDRFGYLRDPFRATKRAITVVCASLALDVEGWEELGSKRHPPPPD
jgi:hypothetical protein